ncbi:cytochrome c biogenesis protein ResB [Streptomyces sp. WAC05374]|uniref:cytochrome c biogenesis protein ResB n=1 Tax=Streptomyces sp. WAC05374 TaxID=2487420 RepID=UPI000F891895|nr:cytochrome c biogenesis protein ResB [Streptomyces sp. WAC05374]RST18244.1 cytochrome c biogenesis protein ResB [Streptomyces sp. WAC05374]TDF40426.1 cytochrome c biogenesis protein ResB [Streptomyces sp. WAC05374]TDF49060.1 cytochrome c biogenesis protein ResB [Streptomyces sp. WAC05374]TDF49545.1 cytochrome c biogenesis protein ResB [Streptomyces sp. WAC05374]
MSTSETTTEHDEAAAGEQLSTAPQEDPAAGGGPALGVIGWVRWFWRQLTSMRVALILLFLLSLGAIPGSLIPQNNVDELKVRSFKEKHETLAPLYDRLQLFDVYSSVWFSAIYILLFVSLIGCIVPRTWQFAGQLRGRPPGAPRRLTRLPAYATWRTGATPEEVRAAALDLLKKRRFRAHTAGDAVAAEKGYLREVGNLLFHIALIVMLVAFAMGQLFKSEGGKLIVEGDGFSNTLTQYDDFKSGSLFSTEELAPFSFRLNQFTGTYESSGPQRGTPRTFEAAVTYSTPGGGKKKGVIRVNEPLEVDGSKVYLISHGYAPVVTVKNGKGEVVFHGAVPLLPIDNNVTSTGVIKVMDGYRDKTGKKVQLGFPAFFVPTYAGKGNGQMFSQFPALAQPALNLSAYHGDLRVDGGLPQNVYQLDTSKMKPFKDPNGDIFKQTLAPGDTMTLPDGAGSITFEKQIKEWASFQISQQPGNGLALAGAIVAIAGLAGSLFIQRRRVWVRAVRGDDGVTVVGMAGLGRSESAKLPEELADLAATLHSVAPTAPDAEAEEAPAEGAGK